MVFDPQGTVYTQMQTRSNSEQISSVFYFLTIIANTHENFCSRECINVRNSGPECSNNNHNFCTEGAFQHARFRFKILFVSSAHVGGFRPRAILLHVYTSNNGRQLNMCAISEPLAHWRHRWAAQPPLALFLPLPCTLAKHFRFKKQPGIMSGFQIARKLAIVKRQVVLC